MSYKKNAQVEVLPVVDLCKKTAKRHFFVGGATQVFAVKAAGLLFFPPSPLFQSLVLHHVGFRMSSFLVLTR